MGPPFSLGLRLGLPWLGRSLAFPVEDVDRRMQEGKSYHEWFELTKLLPSDDGGYDIVKALDENRRWSVP